MMPAGVMLEVDGARLPKMRLYNELLIVLPYRASIIFVTYRSS